MNKALRQNIKLFNKQNIINGLLMFIKMQKKKINSTKLIHINIHIYKIHTYIAV